MTLEAKWNAFAFSRSTAVISPAEFREDWLWGLPLSSANGQTLSDQTIYNKVIQAQNWVEDQVGIKLFKQVITETKDFVREQFFQWGFLTTSWGINQPRSLIGRLAEKPEINYPKEWLTVRRANDNHYTNTLFIVPNGQSSTTINFLATTYTQWFNFYGARIIPEYWHIEYCTGFDYIPPAFLRVIGLLSAIDLLMLIELGVGPMGGQLFGLGNTSLSLDGLSQSITKMNGGNIFKERIKLYVDEAKTALLQLKNMYGGIKFDVC
jgi:hypothetical protein